MVSVVQNRTMSQNFEVTIRLRVTVEDQERLLQAAGEAVPEALCDDPVALQIALQAVVRPPDVDGLPGATRWTGLGWQTSVSAEPLVE